MVAWTSEVWTNGVKKYLSLLFLNALFHLESEEQQYVLCVLYVLNVDNTEKWNSKNRVFHFFLFHFSSSIKWLKTFFCMNSSLNDRFPENFFFKPIGWLLVILFLIMICFVNIFFVSSFLSMTFSLKDFFYSDFVDRLVLEDF